MGVFKVMKVVGKADMETAFTPRTARASGPREEVIKWVKPEKRT